MAKQVAKQAAKPAPKAKGRAAESDDFIPAEAISTGGSYFKPEDGENRIRIITKPVFGWSAWDEIDGEKNHVRTTLDNQPDMSAYDKKNQPKKFMAVMVLDLVEAESDPEAALKLWECTQQSIIKAIQGLAQNAKWGKPYGYDLTIVKTGADKKTRYAVQPDPKSPVDKALIAAANERPVNMDNLFEEEGDIFDTENGVTPYQFK